MSFPAEFIPPLCDGFMDRLENLLLQQQHSKVLLTKIDYCAFTIKLLVERNPTAHQYVLSRILTDKNSFPRHVLDFLLRYEKDMTSDNLSVQITETLCTLIKTVNIPFLNKSMLRFIASKISTTKTVYDGPLGNLLIHLIVQHSGHILQDDKTIQLQVKVYLEHMLLHRHIDPKLSLRIKSFLIQLISSCDEPLTNSVHVTIVEIEYMKKLIVSSSAETSSLKETFQLLHHLVDDCVNRSSFLDHNILDLLEDKMEGEHTEIVAKLISKLLEEDNLTSPQSSHTNMDESDKMITMETNDIKEVLNDDSTDHGAIKLVEKLFPCIAISFQQYRVYVGKNNQTEASTHLMYVSTLIQFINDVLSQETDTTITAVANSIALIEGLSHTIVMMLWASAVLVPYNTEVPSKMYSLWMETFFDIHNCIVQWTSLSVSFCQALLNNGLIHFFETELDKFTKEATAVMNQFLLTHITLILTTIYNLVQKQDCVHKFHRNKGFESKLVMLMVSLPSFELRFLCKLCLGYISPVLSDDVCSLLKFNPEEVNFIVTCFNEVLMSTDYTSSTGFSAKELLDSVHCVVNIGNNLLRLMERGLIDVLCVFLNHSTLQEGTLLFVWSILSSSVVLSPQRERLIAKVTDMTPDDSLVNLYQCVLFSIKKDISSTEEYLCYAEGCFKYGRYQDCIDACSELIKKGNLTIINQRAIKILKGKSLYYAYQGNQRVYLRNRSTAQAKVIEPMKAKLYRMTKECILILGAALDASDLDKDTSEILDRAMIDYVRETNSLKDCKRCLLCRCKKELRRSHIIPKSILKEIAIDLMTDDNDHKVFLPIIGKTVKKSAGEVTFWLLCADCEERLCQNGENQFSEKVFQKVCPNRSILQSDVSIQYGRWFYDFSIGLLFRTLAICDQQYMMECGYDLYKLFALCREHLLCMSPLVHSSKETACDEVKSDLVLSNQLRVYFFVNPTLNLLSSNGRKLPGLFMSPLSLETGIYQHDNQKSFFCAHFDSFNILIQFGDCSYRPFDSTATISPRGGKVSIPHEYIRWRQVPNGVWQVLNVFTQARRIQSREDSVELYSSQKITQLDDSVKINRLPGNFKVSLHDISIPCNLIVLSKKITMWGINQTCTYQLVSDKIQSCYQIIFQIKVPGLCITDGVRLHPHYCFSNGKSDQYHPIKLHVVWKFINEDTEFGNLLLTLEKLT